MMANGGITLPEVEKEQGTDSQKELEPGYLVVCWNDPVNLMGYVTHVFQKVFNWPKEKAKRHMLQVHREGKSVLTRESMERAEHYVHQLHGYCLQATMERKSEIGCQEKGLWHYSMTDREWGFRLKMFELYPLVPDEHHRLASDTVSKDWDEKQRLLEESMREHRLETKSLLRLFADEERLTKTDGGVLLKATSEQREMLLQFFNDIRVGLWLDLGSPEEEDKLKLCLEAETFPKVLAMDYCVVFQQMLLAIRAQRESNRKA